MIVAYLRPDKANGSPAHETVRSFERLVVCTTNLGIRKDHNSEQQDQDDVSDGDSRNASLSVDRDGCKIELSEDIIPVEQ